MGIQMILWVTWFAYWGWAARKTKPSVKMESDLTRWTHLSAVALTFVLLFSRRFHFLHFNMQILPNTTPIILIGVGITTVALAFGIWARRQLGENWSARVTLKEGHQLIRTGPYRWVRHPIYTAFLFGVIGTAISLGEVRGFLAIIVLFTTYHFKMRREETLLTTHFGDEYRRYRDEVNAIIPAFRPQKR
jgi:protein-S-isoprenylcysteine O-methyltransferase Ste14